RMVSCTCGKMGVPAPLDRALEITSAENVPAATSLLRALLLLAVLPVPPRVGSRGLGEFLSLFSSCWSSSRSSVDLKRRLWPMVSTRSLSCWSASDGGGPRAAQEGYLLQPQSW